MKDRWLWSLSFAVLLGCACGEKKPAGLAGSGTMEATEVLVSSKTGGTIVHLAVEEGQEVSEGRLIAVIDSEKVYLQKRQLLAGLKELQYNLLNAQRGVALAEDNLDNTSKKFNRIRALWQDSSATQQQYDDIETAFKASQTQAATSRTAYDALQARQAQLEAQLELLSSQLADCRILAPIQGTVLETYLEKGEIARPTSPVVKLADLRHMWIKVYLKEEELGRVKIGQMAALQIASQPDRRISGRLSWISAKAEFTPKNVQTKEARSDLVYAVKVTADNPDGVLKIGMPADVFLP